MEQARELDIEGRSTMNKDELAAAVEDAQASPAADETVAPDNPDATPPPGDGSEVEYTGTGNPPPTATDESVAPDPAGTVVEAGHVETEQLAGDVEPEVLSSGDVLPAHRREVDGV